jgi:hypothetical protein
MIDIEFLHELLALTVILIVPGYLTLSLRYEQTFKKKLNNLAWKQVPFFDKAVWSFFLSGLILLLGLLTIALIMPTDIRALIESPPNYGAIGMIELIVLIVFFVLWKFEVKEKIDYVVDGLLKPQTPVAKAMANGLKTFFHALAYLLVLVTGLLEEGYQSIPSSRMTL